MVEIHSCCMAHPLTHHIHWHCMHLGGLLGWGGTFNLWLFRHSSRLLLLMNVGVFKKATWRTVMKLLWVSSVSDSLFAVQSRHWLLFGRIRGSYIYFGAIGLVLSATRVDLGIRWVCHPHVVETILSDSALILYCRDHLLTGCCCRISLNYLLPGSNGLWRVNNGTILIHQAVGLYLPNFCSIKNLLLVVNDIAYDWVWWWHILAMLQQILLLLLLLRINGRVIQCVDIVIHWWIYIVLCHHLHLAGMLKIHSRMLQKMLRIFQLLLLLR